MSVSCNSFVAYNRAFPTTRPARGTPAMFYGSPWSVHARAARGFEISRRSAPQPCGNTRQFLAHLFRLACGKTRFRTLETNSLFSFLFPSFSFLMINGGSVTRASEFALLSANFQGRLINILESWRKVLTIDEGKRYFLRALRIST